MMVVLIYIIVAEEAKQKGKNIRGRPVRRRKKRRINEEDDDDDDDEGGE